MNKDQVQILNTMDKDLSAFKALEHGTNSFTTSGSLLLVHFRISVTSFNSKNTLLSINMVLNVHKNHKAY